MSTFDTANNVVIASSRSSRWLPIHDHLELTGPLTSIRFMCRNGTSFMSGALAKFCWREIWKQWYGWESSIRNVG